MDGNSLNGNSQDIAQDKIEQMKQLFPEVFTEGKIDIEKLQATLGENIEFANERYVLNWAGKSDAFRTLQAPTTATLVPDREESVNFDDTDNIFIEGENLEVLKVLQKSYYNKVKMIYIDPPYNTGNDHFIYPDKFSESKKEYMKRIGDKDEEGFLMKEGLFRKNSKDSGHYHSNWLSMMYPRLFLARNLLKDDGVIFVSIGSDELSNLIILSNEIFGEENRVGICVRQAKTGGNTGKYFTPNVEYILVYIKNIEKVEKFSIKMDENLVKKVYTNIETSGYKKGEKYRTMGLYQASLKDLRPNQKYFIECPDGSLVLPHCSIQDETMRPGDGRWRLTKEKFLSELEKGNILFKETSNAILVDEKGKSSKWNIYTKIWLRERQKEGQVPNDLILKFENRHSSKELQKLEIPFDFAKPFSLISHLIQIAGVNSNDIVLDFFSGSASTAHAVLDLNKEDTVNRKFIMVQLPEKTDERSVAHKAGYKTIADIGKERIRRVIKKIEEEKQARTEKQKDEMFKEDQQKDIDLGFKVFKLKPSNFKIWRSDLIETEEDLQTQIEDFIDPVKPDAEEENMLFELLLKSGRDLNSKIIKKECGVSHYYYIDNEITIALDSIDQDMITEIISLKPQKVICLDRLFEDNDQLKTNTALQLKDAGVEFKSI